MKERKDTKKIEKRQRNCDKGIINGKEGKGIRIRLKESCNSRKEDLQERDQRKDEKNVIL